MLSSSGLKTEVNKNNEDNLKNDKFIKNKECNIDIDNIHLNNVDKKDNKINRKSGNDINNLNELTDKKSNLINNNIYKDINTLQNV